MNIAPVKFPSEVETRKSSDKTSQYAKKNRSSLRESESIHTGNSILMNGHALISKFFLLNYLQIYIIFVLIMHV